MFDFGNFDLQSFIRQMALSIVPFLFAITIHEVMHGYVAYKLGDNTAKNAGRLTLNPLKHIDPIGLLFLIITRMFGWAKPVPVNFNNIRHHKYSVALVSIAGPGSNLILAFLSLFLYKFIIYANINIYEIPNMILEPLIRMTIYSMQINVALAVFNLLPIMPLDGARIISNFLPRDIAIRYESTERYGMIILLFLFMTGAVKYIIMPPITFIYAILMRI